MLKVTLIVAGILCLIVAIVLVIGYLLPVGHEASAERTVDLPPARVFATFEAVEREPPRRLVTRIADRSLPFGGTWTDELTPAGSGTRLRITEHGEVYNPVFRFMSRFVFGHTATIDRFLKDVAAARS